MLLETTKLTMSIIDLPHDIVRQVIIHYIDDNNMNIKSCN